MKWVLCSSVCVVLICVLTSWQNILKRLDAGEVVIGDGGFVFALEKRGYVKAGPWTPEAAAEHPEAGRTLLGLHLKLKCWSSSFVSAEWGVLWLQCGSCTESSWELVPMSCRRSLSTQAMTNWRTGARLWASPWVCFHVQLLWAFIKHAQGFKRTQNMKVELIYKWF